MSLVVELTRHLRVHSSNRHELNTWPVLYLLSGWPVWSVQPQTRKSSPTQLDSEPRPWGHWVMILAIWLPWLSIPWTVPCMANSPRPGLRVQPVPWWPHEYKILLTVIKFYIEIIKFYIKFVCFYEFYIKFYTQ